jgi:hypothetical protein
MLIRHAEKPYARHRGVDQNGDPDSESLTPRGWQRAGALAQLFDRESKQLACPTSIYAVSPKLTDGSARPLETVSPLAAKLKLKVKTVGLNAIDRLVAEALAERGDVLICWEHKRIPKIAASILGDVDVPKWGAKRFDIVWLLRKTRRSYRLNIVAQLLLDGDTDALGKVSE